MLLQNDLRHQPLTPSGFNALHEDRAGDRLPLLPDPAHGPDHRAGDRRPEAGVARGVGEHGRDARASTGATSPCRSCCRRSSARSILLFGNAFGAQATAYQLTGGQIPIVTDPDRRPDQRRRPPQPGPRLRAGDGHDRDHGHRDRALLAPPAAIRALAAMTVGPGIGRARGDRRRPGRQCPDREARRERAKIASWIVFISACSTSSCR